MAQTTSTTPIDPALREALRKEILAEEAAAGRIVVVQSPTVSIRKLLTEALTGAIDIAEGRASITALPQSVDQFREGLKQIIQHRITPNPSPPAAFRPEKKGLTGAARCLIQGKRDHLADTLHVKVDEPAIDRTADEVDVLQAVSAGMRATGEELDRRAAPKEDVLFTAIQDAQELLDPVIARDQAVERTFRRMTAYNKGRWQRGANTRRNNAARDQAQRGKITEAVGQELRAQVAEELAKTMVKKMDGPAPAADATATAPATTTTLATPAQPRKARTRRR